MRTRKQLESDVKARYRTLAKYWDIPKGKAVERAEKLIQYNSDSDLREFLSRPLKTCKINDLDPAHRAADKELAKMEKEVSKVYNQATKEMQAKLDNWVKQFDSDDAKMQKKLAAGLISEREYKGWLQEQVMQGQQWKEMLSTLSDDASRTNDIAKSVCYGHMADVYAEGVNFSTYQIEHDAQINTSFTLYDKNTVERLLKDHPRLLPDPSKTSKKAKSKDLRWNSRHIENELLQGILQGESIDSISNRLKRVQNMNQGAVVRYARTMTTSAENGGRMRGYERAQKMGLDIEHSWLATLDSITRDSHRHVDGETVPIGEKFSNGCRYPGDPEGDPGEIYNCRCTDVVQIKGFETDASDLSWRRSEKLGEMSYQEWKDLKDKKNG